MGGAGFEYWRALEAWWRHSHPWTSGSQGNEYPGSVVLAATFLSKHMPDRAEVRVTEKDPSACSRLKAALAAISVNHEVRCCSFLNQVAWLTECDNLVLLIDPFGCYGADGGKQAERVQTGHIDVQILDDLIRKCAGHRRCIIQFWTSTGHLLRKARNPILETLKRWQSRGCSIRWFRVRAYHSFVIGIGDGNSIVDSLPGDIDWRSSWVKNHSNGRQLVHEPHFRSHVSQEPRQNFPARRFKEQRFVYMRARSDW
jgi:hypothetical protein